MPLLVWVLYVVLLGDHLRKLLFFFFLLIYNVSTQDNMFHNRLYSYVSCCVLPHIFFPLSTGFLPLDPLAFCFLCRHVPLPFLFTTSSILTILFMFSWSYTYRKKHIHTCIILYLGKRKHKVESLNLDNFIYHIDFQLYPFSVNIIISVFFVAAQNFIVCAHVLSIFFRRPFVNSLLGWFHFLAI